MTHRDDNLDAWGAAEQATESAATRAVDRLCARVAFMAASELAASELRRAEEAVTEIGKLHERAERAYQRAVEAFDVAEQAARKLGAL